MTKSSSYDFLFFGPTSFTGQYVLEYLLSMSKTRLKNIRWAIVARNMEKVEVLKNTMIEWKALESLKHLPFDTVMLSDITSSEEVSELLQNHTPKVILSTVGPYKTYGRSLVLECAKRGIHYCDITGETEFVKWSLLTLNNLAKDSGCKIVHGCGYDSIPQDYGIYLCRKKMIDSDSQAKGASSSAGHGFQLTNSKTVVWKISGELAGGTLASLIHDLDEKAEARRKQKAEGSSDTQSESSDVKSVSSSGSLLSNASTVMPKNIASGVWYPSYYLTDEEVLFAAGEKIDNSAEKMKSLRRDKVLFPADDFVPRFDNHYNTWVGFFMMAPVNRKTVFRTQTYLNMKSQASQVKTTETGSPFNYQEYLKLPNRLLSYAYISGLGLILGLFQLQLVRNFAAWLRPPGSGGSRTTLTSGYAHHRVWAEGKTQTGKTLAAEGKMFFNNGDPGQIQTSKMLVESALYLLDQTTGSGKLSGFEHSGVLTPVQAFGDGFVERLTKNVGVEMQFEMVSTSLSRL